MSGERGKQKAKEGERSKEGERGRREKGEERRERK